MNVGSSVRSIVSDTFGEQYRWMSVGLSLSGIDENRINRWISVYRLMSDIYIGGCRYLRSFDRFRMPGRSGDGCDRSMSGQSVNIGYDRRKPDNICECWFLRSKPKTADKNVGLTEIFIRSGCDRKMSGPSVNIGYDRRKSGYIGVFRFVYLSQKWSAKCRFHINNRWISDNIG